LQVTLRVTVPLSRVTCESTVLPPVPVKVVSRW
jgi:hypothetical protein